MQFYFLLDELVFFKQNSKETLQFLFPLLACSTALNVFSTSSIKPRPPVIVLVSSPPELYSILASSGCFDPTDRSKDGFLIKAHWSPVDNGLLDNLIHKTFSPRPKPYEHLGGVL